MKLTEHFTKQEMERSNTATRLGLSNACPFELMPNILKVAAALELVREHFGLPVRVLSCYRSPAVNQAVGGSKTSAHRFALAADIVIQGVPNIKVCEWCAANIPEYDQVIYEFGEGGWCHLGFTNKEPRRQYLAATKVDGRTVYKNRKVN